MRRTPSLQYRTSTHVSHYNGPKVISNGSKRNLFVASIMDLQVMYVNI